MSVDTNDRRLSDRFSFLRFIKSLTELLICFQTPLHMAVIMKQPAIVRILLRGSASPKVCYQNGNTSIQLAVVKDSIQCLQALLEVASLDEIDHKNYNGKLIHLVKISFPFLNFAFTVTKARPIRCTVFFFQFSTQVFPPIFIST